ncbi:MAG: EFR1 family ferrodoxin [Treponema sp.]|jgi:NAD-dependent dihydropyrimidine dehydrogenase PreA subunit|nr:EFR1 family ferrodoxin [Treponema sp.]
MNPQRPKRILLIVFSGTGNTLLIAEMLRDHFREKGAEADILSIPPKEGRAVHLDSYDLVGLGYPVYAFNVPLFFLRFVRELDLRRKEAFIFKTSGEPTTFNRGSSWALLKLLKRQHCSILGDYHFLMPYNIIFRFPEGLVKQMYLYARRYTALAAANVLKGVPSFISFTFLHRLFSFVFRIQRAGAALNGRLYGIRKKRCTLCLLCLRNCPAKNISLKNNTLQFGFNCQMCMRCSFFCPPDAMITGFLNPWRVNGAFPFKKLAADKNIAERFIGEGTRGFYRIFIPYFRELDRILPE